MYYQKLFSVLLLYKIQKYMSFSFGIKNHGGKVQVQLGKNCNNCKRKGPNFGPKAKIKNGFV